MTTVSVALCTFNGERYLGGQLDSLATQTRPPDELVVCDDGSKDGTIGVIEAFAATAPFPVRLHRNPERLGIAVNFARAISFCEGDVIALSDQDDVWHPDKLARGLAVLERRPEVGAVFSDADLVDESMQPLGQSLYEALRFTPRRQRHFGLATLLARQVVCGATLAFRQSYSDLVLPIPPTGLHDVWLATILAGVTQVVPLPDRLMQYRQHGANQIGSPAKGMRQKLARRRVKGVFGDEIAHYGAIAERLRPHDPESAGLVDEKVRHLRFRYDLPSPRFVPIVKELAAGRYHRYSRGWESAGFDLFFRERESAQGAAQ